LREQPEIEIPAGIARHIKQTSVKNRRMNPPRPTLSISGTVSSEYVKKLGLKRAVNLPKPACRRINPLHDRLSAGSTSTRPADERALDTSSKSVSGRAGNRHKAVPARGPHWLFS
jgi:hypothetical protein